MKKMAKDIFSFKKGDIITRVENAKIKTMKFNENLGIEMETVAFEDNSYRGEPLEFVAIENNMCYFKGVLGLFKGLNIKFELGNGWEEGWDYYVEVNNEIRESNQSRNIFEKSFAEVDAALSYKPYSYKSILNLLFVKKYQILFQENVIDTRWFFSKKSIESHVYILNGAFMAGSLYSVLNKMKNKWGVI
jgi:hypothetical protein